MEIFDLRVRHKTRRAMALVMALLIITLLVLAAALSVGMLVKRQQDLHREVRAVHLQSLLDSGVALALSIYAQNREFTGRQSLDLDDGRVEIDASFVANTRRAVEVLATYQGDQRLATVVLYVPPSGLPRLVDWQYGPPPRLR